MFPATEKDLLCQIIQKQIRRYKEFKVEDLYKLIYQVTCGGGHLLEDRRIAEKMLHEEWENAGKILKGETLLEMIDPRGGILRVNIRIYKKIGGSFARLFDLFIRSAESYKKDERRLILYWQYVLEMVSKDDIPFEEKTLTAFWNEVEKKGFPPIHHSKSYVEANCPSYRVVLKSLWEESKIGRDFV